MDGDLPAPLPPGHRDPWLALGRFTPARIALGRAGGSQRTPSVLDFRMAHARARDAVARAFSPEAVEGALGAAGIECVRLASQAGSRPEYLMRPDRGRRLSPASREALTGRRGAWGQRDLALIVSDGLSALAAERHAAPLLAALVPLLRARGWTLFPVFVIPCARVKLQDELGSLLSARQTVILLGERPGLGAPDSLGAYLTYRPRPECTDADRNCISNIRAEGIDPDAAAHKLAHLLSESVRLGASGVALKDGPGQAAIGPGSV